MTNNGMEHPEKLALKSHASLQLLVDNVQHVAIFTVDLQGRLAGWNIGAQHILGYDEAEFLGQPFSIIFTPEDRATGADQAEMREALQHGHANDERWQLRKGGIRFFVSGLLTLLRDESGEPYGFVKIMRDLTERKQIELSVQKAYTQLEQQIQQRTAELAAAHQARRELLRKLVATQEEERARIARELHDQSAQQLTTLIFGLNNLKNLLLSATALESVDTLIPIARSLMDDLHMTIQAIRPPLLDIFGLDEALRDYAEKWSTLSHIPVDIEFLGFNTDRLSPELEITLYRIVQEALTNILRHGASATRVFVQVSWQTDKVNTTIEDNGPGFDVAAMLNLPIQKRRLGILGMQERAAAMGGVLTVESAVGHGTTIRMQLPYQVN